MTDFTSGNLRLKKSSFSQPGSQHVITAAYDDNLEAIDAALVIQTATVTLSAADIDALNLTPFLVVPASVLGAHQYVKPLDISLSYKFGTAPYTVPPGVFLILTNPLLFADPAFSGFGGWAEIASTNLLDAAADILGYPIALIGLVDNNPKLLDPASVVGQGLYIQNDRAAAAYADGDGTLTVTVDYTVVTLS